MARHLRAPLRATDPATRRVFSSAQINRDECMARVFVSGSSTGLGLLAGKDLLAAGHDVVFHALELGPALAR
jgi:hypothetical protein